MKDGGAAVDELLAVRLWSLLDAFEVRLAAELEGLDITVAGFRLIGEVMQSLDGVRQSELARRLRVTPSTVSTAVTRLEERGLVRRVADPDDPRAWRVCLDADARLLAGVEVLQRIDADLTAGMSTTGQMRLMRNLDQLRCQLRQEPEEDA